MKKESRIAAEMPLSERGPALLIVHDREEDVGAGRVHKHYLMCKYAKCIDKNI